MENKPAFFIDEPETKNLVLDFPNYIKALSEIILNSKPRYNIGIFGGWGTGKTTLMENVKEVLTKNDCNCLDFNAWRYALEPRHATFPLMLGIIFKLLALKEVQDNTDSFLQKLKTKASRVAKGLKFNLSVNIPFLAQAGVEADIKEMMTSSDSDLTNLEASKPILQEGIEVIQELLKYVQGPKKNSSLKLVLFIDDLDRCTPEKVTEIFESIKIFFDIEGIVFVLGLNPEIVEEAINKKYKEFGDIFSGKDYLKKIIQVPFQLPVWSTVDIQGYLDKIIENYEDDSYKKFFTENLSLLYNSLEPNPREVKRVLNSFILSYQIQRDHELIKPQKLLALIILAQRWRDFYERIMVYPRDLSTICARWEKICQDVDKESGTDSDLYIQNLEEKIKNDPFLMKIDDIEEIMFFLDNQGHIIRGMTQAELKEYRRATIVEPSLKFLQEIKKEGKKKEPILAKIAPPKMKPNSAKVQKFTKSGGISGKGQMQPVLVCEFNEVSPDAARVIRFQYHAWDKHCSDIRLHIYLDGVDVGTTEWLGYPGRDPELSMKTEIISIENVLVRNHILTFQPQGREGGCNHGYISDWGGEMYFFQ